MTRYDLVDGGDGMPAEMVPLTDGDWVRWDDAQAELAELRAVVARGVWGENHEHFGGWWINHMAHEEQAIIRAAHAAKGKP